MGEHVDIWSSVACDLYCTLEYSPLSRSDKNNQIKPVIILVLQDAKSTLRFMVHPKLSEMVRPIDLHYIQTILDDFHVRAKLHPEPLFRQLSSLAVGPLRTGTVARIPSSLVEYALLVSRFVPLKCPGMTSPHGLDSSDFVPQNFYAELDRRA